LRNNKRSSSPGGGTEDTMNKSKMARIGSFVDLSRGAKAVDSKHILDNGRAAAPYPSAFPPPQQRGLLALIGERSTFSRAPFRTRQARRAQFFSRRLAAVSVAKASGSPSRDAYSPPRVRRARRSRIRVQGKGRLDGSVFFPFG